LRAESSESASLVLWTCCAVEIPTFLALLVSVNAFRRNGNGSSAVSGRVLQCIFGAFATVPAVLALIRIISADTISFQAPGAVVTAMAALVLGMFAAATSGILAIIASKPVFVRGVNDASTFCAAAAIGLGVIALLTLLGAFQDSVQATVRSLGGIGSALIWVLIRYGIIFVSLLVWNATAVYELLVSSSLKKD